MNVGITALALIRAVGYKGGVLAGRRIQELGASPFGMFKLFRYAVIPAAIWSLIFVRPDDIVEIVNSPILPFVILVPIVWNAQVALNAYVLNTTSSLSGLGSLQRLIALPLFLLVGIFLNNDTPNVLSLLALVALAASLLIQPAQHQTNLRARYSKAFLVVAGVLLLRTVLESIAFGLDREVLKVVDPLAYVGIYGLLTAGLCALWTPFIPMKRMVLKQDKETIRRNLRVAVLVPGLWFAATIPDMFVLAALPIYTVIAIDAITFGMDTVSDLIHKRIRFNLQTASFIVLVLTGIVLAVLSI